MHIECINIYNNSFMSNDFNIINQTLILYKHFVKRLHQKQELTNSFK